jgi:uncharacterized protein (TIGR02284 family)
VGFALTVWRFFVASTLSSPFGVSLPLLRCPRLFPGCIFSDLTSGPDNLYSTKPLTRLSRRRTNISFGKNRISPGAGQIAGSGRLRSGGHMAKTQSEVLNDLISTCRDSQEGYSKAAKGVHSDDLRRVLMNIFEERGRFVEELQAMVRNQSDGHVADRPHGGGPMHRGWSELEARIRPKGDPEILVNCLDGMPRLWIITIMRWRAGYSAMTPDK